MPKKHLKIVQNVAFEFWHFPPISITCLVTLFDSKFQVFNIERDFFYYFQTLCFMTLILTVIFSKIRNGSTNTTPMHKYVLDCICILSWLDSAFLSRSVVS